MNVVDVAAIARRHSTEDLDGNRETSKSLSVFSQDTNGVDESCTGGDRPIVRGTVRVKPSLATRSLLYFSKDLNDYNIYDFSGTLLECSSHDTDCRADGSGIGLTGLSIVETPEPSTKLLLLSGLGALLLVAARKRPRIRAAG